MNKTEKIEKNKKELLEYLNLISKQSKNRPEGYILATGTLFIGREPSKNIIKTNLKPIKRQCYYNAQNLAIEQKLKYFEGIAFNGSAPFEHAWCVAGDKVIDITWELRDEIFNIDNDKTCIYYGIEIPLDFVWKNQQETQTAESLLLKYLYSQGYLNPT